MQKLWLIYNGSIVGEAPSPDDLPNGFSAIEGEDLPIDQLYFDGEAIQVKPPQPSSSHVWSEAEHEWIAVLPISPATSSAIAIEDWKGLENALTGSPLWVKVYRAASSTLRANAAFTTLLTVLTSTQRVDRLVEVFDLLREAMKAIAQVGDFTLPELEQIGELLASNGFDATLFHLDPLLN